MIQISKLQKNVTSHPTISNLIKTVGGTYCCPHIYLCIYSLIYFWLVFFDFIFTFIIAVCRFTHIVTFVCIVDSSPLKTSVPVNGVRGFNWSVEIRLCPLVLRLRLCYNSGLTFMGGSALNDTY